MGKTKKIAALILTGIPILWGAVGVSLWFANDFYVQTHEFVEWGWWPLLAYFFTLPFIAPIMLMLSILGIVFAKKARDLGEHTVWIIVLAAIAIAFHVVAGVYAFYTIYV
ncbi:MAG: hypothetical protein K6F68_02765 [Clostridiales bacterium]|nr:hypothetical protein [Clostridiales bacterium]